MKPDGSSRQDYSYEDDLSSFILKEKKDGKASVGSSSYLFVEYQWKITFPEMPMLKSFKHGESVRI